MKTEEGNSSGPNIKGAATIIGAVVLVAGIGYGAYYSYSIYKELQETKQELAARTAGFEEDIRALQESLAETETRHREALDILSDEQRKNLDLQREQRQRQQEIDELARLTSLDPELLKKYSKVYFLSENYTPARLEEVDDRYWVDPARPMLVLSQVESPLDDLLDDARRDGIDLRITSAFRSFEEQGQLKSGYVVQYGTGANAFSAEQGYSEHQLGTTVDFTTPQLVGAVLAFENTEAFEWLMENAHNYGFVLSYPKGNQHYVYEPWHWRFVGEELARDLHSEGRNFYDLDQREIDKYLIDIFE